MVAPVNFMFNLQRGTDLDGYVKCVEMRRFYKNPNEYDEKLKNYILLGQHEIKGPDSHDVWTEFQHKFTIVNGKI